MPAYSSLRYPKKTFDGPRRPASSAMASQGPYLEREKQVHHHHLPHPLHHIFSLLTCYSPFQLGDATADDVFTDPPQGYGTARQSAQGVPMQSGPQGWTLVPREGAQDPQAIYPSSACVFVANLCHNFDDVTLEVEVTRYFARFGTVFVKIRRDGRQMPFAFCQFTTDFDADNAEKYGSGAMIFGRPCRVEKATANSCFIVSKLSGQDITRQEAYNLLSPLGIIDKVYPLARGHKTGKLPPAMVVHYKRYDSYRSVVKTFEGHPFFRVDAFDPKTGRLQNRDPQGFAQYDKDRRSAYFGNLPMNMTSPGLERLASACGNVVCAEVATKQVPQMGGTTIMTCFGFVEYTRPDSVDNAIMSFHRKPMNGHLVKVERKRTRALNAFNYASSVPRAAVPSTWHGGRIGNRGNRTLNEVFEPPVSPAAAMPLHAKRTEAHESPRASAKEGPAVPACFPSTAASVATMRGERLTPATMSQAIPEPPKHVESPQQDTEPSCLYPVLSPYPYSPYGFHPFMGSQMTPQGGPALYNYGQYYYPAPSTDLYTMYPMQQYQHYPAPQDTPTRRGMAPQAKEH
ncbi:hypothetical protein ACQKWADRAFT_331677 [Trichoderma austrokoningii]